MTLPSSDREGSLSLVLASGNCGQLEQATHEHTKSMNADRFASGPLPASASITVTVCSYDRPKMLRGLLPKRLTASTASRRTIAWCASSRAAKT